MEEALTEFKSEHALLLTEIRRLTDEEVDDVRVARSKELRSILKVVARSFLQERVDPRVTEDELREWLQRLEAA
jgi:hypothetical protein